MYNNNTVFARKVFLYNKQVFRYIDGLVMVVRATMVTNRFKANIEMNTIIYMKYCSSNTRVTERFSTQDYISFFCMSLGK